MSTLTTRTGPSGTIAVYHARAKIGYVVGDVCNSTRWHWELIMISEQCAGHPRGVAESREAALARLEEMFNRWCEAAGLEKKT